MARQFGVRRVAIPTAGNAGGAMAAYAARAGMEAFVFMPSDAPAINQFEAQAAGAKVFLVDGLITDEPALAVSVLEQRADMNIAEKMALFLADKLGLTLNTGEYRDASP